MRRALGVLLAVLSAELALWAVMLAGTATAGKAGPDSDLAPVVTDRPAATRIVIDGALP